MHDTKAALDKGDEKEVADKADKLAGEQVEIDPQLMGLDLEDFPGLEDEEEGDKIVIVLSGYVTSVTEDQAIVSFSHASLVHGKKPPLGSGQRFKMLENELSHKPGIENPGALAAYIGRKKYGKSRFQKLSAAGRKK